MEIIIATNEINTQQSVVCKSPIAEQIILLNINENMFSKGIIDENERDRIKKLINNDYQSSYSF